MFYETKFLVIYISYKYFRVCKKQINFVELYMNLTH